MIPRPQLYVVFGVLALLGGGTIALGLVHGPATAMLSGGCLLAGLIGTGILVYKDCQR